jgi:hypothetical protein
MGLQLDTKLKIIKQDIHDTRQYYTCWPPCHMHTTITLQHVSTLGHDQVYILELSSKHSQIYPSERQT